MKISWRLTTRWSRPGQLRQNVIQEYSKSWPGGSSRGRYASARRRKMIRLVWVSKGEHACLQIVQRLVMAPRLRRSLSMMQVTPVGLRGEGVVGGLPGRAPARRCLAGC